MKKLLYMILCLLISTNVEAGYKPKVKEKNSSGLIISILGPMIKDSPSKWYKALEKAQNLAIKHCSSFGKNTYVFWSDTFGIFARNTNGNLLSWVSYSGESKNFAKGFIQDYDDKGLGIKFRYLCSENELKAFKIIKNHYKNFNIDYKTNLVDVQNLTFQN